MMKKQLAYARDVARADHAEALELLRRLARIPAPSHHEERRALAICQWMREMGMPAAYVDGATNVICPLADDGTCDLIVFAAHTDIVFPDTEELPLHEEGGRIYAPGVGDDTANLVALLMAARHLANHSELLPTSHGVLVVANTGEEGLGNLKGTRALFAAYGQRISRFYSFDLYLPGIVSTAVGSHRWRITVRTQGGHSFSDFGRPNAIERLCALVEELYRIPLPSGCPCTLNVGQIEGGTTVNAIAARASCLFEYRSTSDEVLQQLKAQLESIVGRYATSDVCIELEGLGERPASAGEPSLTLRAMTQHSREVIAAITGEEPQERAASTDANIPLSLGIPANTIGAVRGALLHTRSEWVDAASVEEGIAVVLGIMLTQHEL